MPKVEKTTLEKIFNCSDAVQAYIVEKISERLHPRKRFLFPDYSYYEIFQDNSLMFRNKQYVIFWANAYKCIDDMNFSGKAWTKTDADLLGISEIEDAERDLLIYIHENDENVAKEFFLSHGGVKEK